MEDQIEDEEFQDHANREMKDPKPWGRRRRRGGSWEADHGFNERSSNPLFQSSAGLNVISVHITTALLANSPELVVNVKNKDIFISFLNLSVVIR